MMASLSMRLLIVEDNPELVANLFEFLEPRGYTLDAAPDGVTGLYLAGSQDYDAIILDWMLPRMNGQALLENLRNEYAKTTPVIMLTARDSLPDKIIGFRSGADDYLTKPFSLIELELRIKALVGRATGRAHKRTIEACGVSLDLGTLDATREGKQIRLYPASRKILELLLLTSPDVVPRSKLERALWGDEPPDGDMLRSHIYELRQAIDGGFKEKLIHTIPRVGYVLSRKSQDDEN